jgi:hypothetical protein
LVNLEPPLADDEIEPTRRLFSRARVIIRLPSLT